ncbi:MAG: tetratricopeptide repeat protein [Alphaproteobacteria bacterium]|nr:MAG: tetratricopeptide repeat protein [Alphaproteobacteria bacterium]
MVFRFLTILSITVILGACTLLDAAGGNSSTANTADNAAPAAETAQKAEPAETATTEETDAVSEFTETPDGVAGSYLASRAALQDANFTRSAEFLQQALDKDPTNQSLIERVCLLYIMSGQVEKSLPLAQIWQTNKKNSLLPSLVLFLQNVKTGKLADAEIQLKAMEDAKLNKLTLPLLRAWMNAAEGKTDAAIDVLKPLFPSETAGGIILLHAALISEYANNYNAAMDFYTQAASRFTVMPLRLSMSMGNLYERLVEPAKAKELYDAFTKRSPNNYIFDAAYARLEKGGVAPANIRTSTDGIAQVLFDIATSFEGQAGSEMAIVYAQLSNYMQPDFEFNQLLMAELFEAFEQFDESAAIHAKLMGNPAFYWSAGLRLARDYDKMGQQAKSVEILEKMRKAQPKRVEAVTMLGDLYRNRKDYAAAIEAYSEAIENSEPVGKTDWPLFYARGTAFERAGLWTQAEKDLQQSLELSPEQPYVMNYLAYSWVERGERLDEALGLLEKAVALAPGDAFIIDSLGWALYRMGKYNDAEKILQKAVEARPYDPQLIDHYGDALWRLDRAEQARIQWNRALSFEPDAELKKSIDGKLEKGLKQQSMQEPKDSPAPAPASKPDNTDLLN